MAPSTRFSIIDYNDEKLDLKSSKYTDLTVTLPLIELVKNYPLPAAVLRMNDLKLHNLQ